VVAPSSVPDRIKKCMGVFGSAVPGAASEVSGRKGGGPMATKACMSSTRAGNLLGLATLAVLAENQMRRGVFAVRIICLYISSARWHRELLVAIPPPPPPQKKKKQTPKTRRKRPAPTKDQKKRGAYHGASGALCGGGLG